MATPSTRATGGGTKAGRGQGTFEWVRRPGEGDQCIILFPGFLTRGRVLYRRHLDVFAEYGAVGLVEYARSGNPYSGDLLGRVVAEILRARREGSVILVGASFGAQVAINILRRLGADRSVVAGYVSVGGPTDADDVRPSLAILGRLRLFTPALVPVKNAILDRMMPGLGREALSPEADEADISIRREDTLSTTAGALTGRLAAMRVQQPLAVGEFDSVRAVSIHAQDDGDPYVHGQAEDKIAGAFRESRRGHRVPAGHINFLEHPDAYTTAIVDALAWATQCHNAESQSTKG